MRFSRDLLAVLVLFAILIGFTIVSSVRRAEIQQQSETPLPYSTNSALPNGTFALQKWLVAIGYQGRRAEGDAFNLPTETRVLFVFLAESGFNDADAQLVLRWVERGNTLIVAQANPQPAGDRLAALLKFKLLPVGFVDRAAVAEPLNGVALSAPVRVRTPWGLDLARDDFVEYLTAVGKPLLASWVQGRGKVFVSSAPFLFTNESLHDEANAALVLALLNGVPRGSVILLDEFHLRPAAQQGGCTESLQSLLYCTPWGWSIIFAFFVVFAYLAINGRRFGRVAPLPQDIARRSPVEYVQSTAQLFRRAGKRRMVLEHYRRQLKRALGKPYRINAGLPDDEFVQELARYREFDRAELVRVLHALDRSAVDERSLVRLAAEAIRLRRSAETHT